jgi:hypothetical protein
MSKINVVTVTNGQNISAINSNFAAIATHLNTLVSYRNNPVGEANEMHNDVDFNSFRILNLSELNVTSLVVDGVSIDGAIEQTAANAAAAQVSAASAAASAASAAASVANSLSKVNNLSDVASPAVSRTNLGLGNVDNTSDVNKPVSTAQAAAIALKANIASPTFTGVPAGPTAAVDTNTTQFATTQFYVSQASSTLPLINGTAAIGTALRFARSDHVHPTDTTRAPIASPTFTTGATVSGSNLTITAAAGAAKNLTMQSGGLNRWAVTSESTAESGSNAGSNFLLSRYNDAGTYIDSPIQIIRSNGGVAARGTNTNDSAPAGYIGEYSTVSTGSIGLTSATFTGLTSLLLQPGDWDVEGTVLYVPAATTQIQITSTGVSGSASSLTFGLGSYQQNGYGSGTANQTQTGITPTWRVSISSATTIYLVGYCQFSVSTCSCNGLLRARRVR